MDFGQLAIDTLRAQGASMQAGMQLGRAAFARDVLSIIGTASIHKPLPDVIAELIDKCGEEQRK